jgi:hypothetical protein
MPVLRRTTMTQRLFPETISMQRESSESAFDLSAAVQRATKSGILASS